MRPFSPFSRLCLLMAATACVERGEVLRSEANRGVESEGGAGSGGSGGTTLTAGLGGSAGSPAPSAVLSSISLGTAHGAALSANRLFAWGNNESGELGQGDTTQRHVPTEVASEVRFATGVRTGRGLPIKKGERGRVTGVRHQPDGELVIVNVRNVGEVLVGNAGALELAD